MNTIPTRVPLDTSNGTCLVCLTPTDTAIATRGIAEWHIAFAEVLGVPEDEAAAMLTNDADLVPAGVYGMTWRVCASCVAASPASFPAPVLALPGTPLPTIAPSI